MNGPRYLAGVDIGGTSTDAILATRQGEPLARITIPTSAAGGDSVVSSTIKAIDSVVEEAENRVSDLTAIGLGIPGQVEPETGIVRSARNLGIGADGYPIAAAVANHYRKPTAVENDVRAAALGLYDREPVPPDILTYLSIGTGISAGTVIEGDLLRGSRGVAGELGQIPIAISTSAAGTTLISSEDAAAGPAIGTTAEEAGIARDRFFSTPAARPVLEIIARVVHTILVAYDPDILYVGGGVTRSVGFHAALITAVDDLRARTCCEFVDVSRISAIATGFHPGMAGAIYLAKQATEESGRQARPAKKEETP
jgi:predicted NBD/HSP70 family sugar kinase